MSVVNETPRGLAGLAARFILETNTFLARHWAEAKTWWPLKSAGDRAAEPCGDPPADTNTPAPRVFTPDADELVLRLIQGCALVRTQEVDISRPPHGIHGETNAEPVSIGFAESDEAA